MTSPGGHGAPDIDRTSSPGPSRAGSSSTTGQKAISADSFYAPSKPKGDKIVLGEKSSKKRMEWSGALHDPNAEGAVVMQRPSEKETKRR